MHSLPAAALLPPPTTFDLGCVIDALLPKWGLPPHTASLLANFQRSGCFPYFFI